MRNEDLRTVRFAHGRVKSPIREGQIVKKGDIIMIMGQSGDSTVEDHLHTDCAIGHQAECFYTSQIRSGQIKTDNDFLIQFFNNELFGEPFHISNFPYQRSYYRNVGYDHEGFDLVPKNYPAKYDIYIRWPLDIPGLCIANYYDKPGYGNSVHFLLESI